MKESELDFKIDDSNKLLNHMYKQDNFKIIDGMADNKKCIIVCSSNGIYFPDTYDEFREKIICKNFFEGRRISSFLIEYVERIILIRDIRKNYYVTGINEKYNSIDSVLCMMKKLTQGYEVIVAGGSAGGYMATIIGSYLNAEYVINSGGQWNLYKHDNTIEKCFFLRKNIHNSCCSKWFDLNTQMPSNHVLIMYMYGALNELDVAQLKCAENIDNVCPVAIKSEVHAQSVSSESYLRLLYATREEILKICSNMKGRLVEVRELEEEINSQIELPKGLEYHCAMTVEQKQNAYIDLLYEWVRLNQSMRLNDNGGYIICGKVAIYGKGRYCDLLISDLTKQAVEVCCIIETQPLTCNYKGIPVVGVRDIPDDVKTIIVIPYYDIEDIKENIIMRWNKEIDVIGIDEYIRSRYKEFEHNQ